MDHYAPKPTAAQLDAIAEGLGTTVRYGRRIDGGLGGTTDVLRLGVDGEKVILRRYWLPEPGEIDPAVSEVRALILAAAAGVPVPEPLWLDRAGVFPERAMVMSFVEGTVVLEPAEPILWAEQLAETLVAIHRIRPGPEDADVFPTLTSGTSPHGTEAVGGRDDPLTNRLAEAIASSRTALTSVEPTYVHHDFWAGNTLWRDTTLAAVIDWEGGAIGDPLLDVAYCAVDMRLLHHDAAAVRFVSRYAEMSGRTLDNLAYWTLVGLSRPLPDIAIWVPGWNAMGVPITAPEARTRHRMLIEEALCGGGSDRFA